MQSKQPESGWGNSRSINLQLANEGLLLATPALRLLAVPLFAHCPQPLLNANSLPPTLGKVLLYQTTGWGDSMLFWEWGWKKPRLGIEERKAVLKRIERQSRDLRERQKIRRAVADRKRNIKPRGWKNGKERQMSRGEIPALYHSWELTNFQTVEKFFFFNKSSGRFV